MNKPANFGWGPAMLTRRSFLCGAGMIAGFAAGRLLYAQGTNAPKERHQEGGNALAAPLQTASTHPMKYYISLPKGWSADRAWPVLVAPNSHYGDKGSNLGLFTAERDRRRAGFIIIQPLVINADRVENMGEYRGAVANAIKTADAATDGRDENARARFDAEGLMAILKDVTRIYHGEKKVYITGCSSSTHVAYLMLMNHPELLKGAIINSGVYLGRGVDEAHLPLTHSPERAGVAVKYIVGENDGGYAKYIENWKETKAKLLGWGHPAEKIQEEIIRQGNPERLGTGHQWFPTKIMDFCIGVENGESRRVSNVIP